AGFGGDVGQGRSGEELSQRRDGIWKLVPALNSCRAMSSLSLLRTTFVRAPIPNGDSPRRVVSEAAIGVQRASIILRLNSSGKRFCKTQPARKGAEWRGDGAPTSRQTTIERV